MVAFLCVTESRGNFSVMVEIESAENKQKLTLSHEPLPQNTDRQAPSNVTFVNSANQNGSI